jgi:signal transduction histidine kinase
MQPFYEALIEQANAVAYVESACKVLRSYGIDALLFYHANGRVHIQAGQHALEFATLRDIVDPESDRAIARLFSRACDAAGVSLGAV